MDLYVRRNNYFNIIIWAFITDIIDYQEIRTGQREDGTIYAVYSFARKNAQEYASLYQNAPANSTVFLYFCCLLY